MNTKQVMFRCIDPNIADPSEVLAGIRVEDSAGKVFYICGECGGIFFEEDCELVQEFKNWVNLRTAIADEYWEY